METNMEKRSNDFATRWMKRLNKHLLACKEHSASKAKVLVGGLVVLYLFLSFSTLYLINDGAIHIVLLFLLPFGIQGAVTYWKEEGILRGFFSLYGFFWGTLIVQIAWLLYLWGLSSILPGVSRFLLLGNGLPLSWISIFFALLGAGVACVVTWIIMPRSSNEFEQYSNINTFRKEIKKNPLSTIFFFIGLFLCITYLFSFSLAFHNEGIYIESDSTKVALYAGLASDQSDDAKEDSQNAEEDTRRIFFKISSEEVLVDPEITRTYKEILARIKGDFSRDYQTARLFLRRNLNKKAIDFITDYIHSIDSTSPYKYIELSFTGHASQDQPSPTRRDNDAWSEFRGFRVHSYLSRHLREHISKAASSERAFEMYNITYTHRPKGDQTDPSAFVDNLHSALVFPEDPEAFENGEPSGALAELINLRIQREKIWPDSMLSVEVTIRPENHPSQIRLKELAEREPLPYKLNLLDYVYFTVYTITTTGYGDIQPKTPQTKFISSLANLIEVFFLVVFFNALLSFTGRSRES